jgi:hypothetical protein
MRRTLGARVGWPLAAVLGGFTVAAGMGRGWALLIVGVLMTPQAWSEVVVIREGILYRRGWRWSEPLLLEHLSSIRVTSWPRHGRRGVLIEDWHGRRWCYRPEAYEPTVPLAHHLLDVIETDRTVVAEQEAVRRLVNAVRRR